MRIAKFSSIKAKPPFDVNMLPQDYLSNWMKYNWSEIKEKHLNELVVPASHHSAYLMDENLSTNKIKKYLSRIFATCQKTSVKEQLNSGVRMLDLRISEEKGHLSSPESKIVISHYFRTKITLKSVLEDVLEFLKDKKMEIVSLFIREDYDSPLTEEAFLTVHKIVVEACHGMLIENLHSNKRIDELIKFGQIVLLGLDDSRCLIKSAKISFNRRLWWSFKTSWIDSNSSSPSKVIKKLENFLAATEKSKDYLNITEIIVTPTAKSFLLHPKAWYNREVTTSINNYALQILKEPFSKYRIYCLLLKGNFLLFDFITQNLALIIVELNKS